MTYLSSSSNASTEASAQPTPPTLTLAEINTLDLISQHTDHSGQTIVKLHRDGRELDLDAFGHFMDLVEQSRGPWITPSSPHDAHTVIPHLWRNALNEATVLQGEQAQAVSRAIQSLHTLQASLPALIERLREVVGEHEAKKESNSLSSLFRSR